MKRFVKAKPIVKEVKKVEEKPVKKIKSEPKKKTYKKSK